MHVQTHILSGWLAGNLVPAFGPRERFFCMLAASLSDLDGLSLLGGWECYYDIMSWRTTCRLRWCWPGGWRSFRSRA